MKANKDTMLNKICLLVLILLFASLSSTAQIEVDHISLKEFKQTGFGGFLNFAIPVSDADYVTAEVGLNYFSDKYDEDLAMVPFILGYRYTINRSGTGIYVEPNAGYVYGATTIQEYDANGQLIADENGTILNENISGATAGVNIGYLFKPAGHIQFNIALRFEHGFGPFPTNMVGLRIAHAFTFGRRDKDE